MPLIILFSFNHQAVTSCQKDGSEWQPAEAALYCMQTVAKFIPSIEGEMVPKV